MRQEFSNKENLIPMEEVARLPLPGMSIPTRLAFSPDDRLISYLFSSEGGLTQQLHAYEIESGEHRLLVSPPSQSGLEANISLEESLRRERLRRVELGITDYCWSADGNRLLIPIDGDLYISDAPFQPLRVLVPGNGVPIQDAQFSPDGNWIAYVQDAEIYTASVSSGEALQLTSGARGTGKTHGLAEYIAQEEMGRQYGFWWSPDSQRIAYIQVDETHIPVYRIVHQGKQQTGLGAQEDHRYPFAGQSNARVRLGVIPRQGGETHWLDLDIKDHYLARVNWLPDGRLGIQVENRQQTELEFFVYTSADVAIKRLFKETSPVWINLHDLFCPLKKPYKGQNGCFLWASERSGFRHLYLMDRNGEPIRALTHGEWIVDAIAGVDEVHQQVYFTATKDSPLECHLYVTSFEGGDARRITQAAGTHQVVIDHACRYFVDTFNSISQSPRQTLCSLKDGAKVAILFEKIDPRLEQIHLSPPELVKLNNRHGDLLYGAIYRPPQRFGYGPFPTVVFVYGGPHAQMVINSWLLTVRMRAQYLSSLGFLVFTLDNRGSARRGLEFEGVIKHKMGHFEVEDQIDGVNWLVEQGLAVAGKVGINGWSYGGYMAAMCVLKAQETFSAAVAGAPVTDWDGYDTHYTERYMGTPQSNPDGYMQSSVLSHAENLRGSLMLVHGLIDENVHFRHTARLINALITARKGYELVLFPDERHLPRKLADRVYMEERIRDFFMKHLMS
jgi:dipeptidyl-peptidase-4